MRIQAKHHGMNDSSLIGNQMKFSYEVVLVHKVYPGCVGNPILTLRSIFPPVPDGPQLCEGFERSRTILLLH